MQDHLVTITGRPAIEVRTQRALGQPAERIRTTLGRRHLFADLIARRGVRGFAEQAVGGCLERALHNRTELWLMLEPAERPQPAIAQAIIGSARREALLVFALRAAWLSAGLLSLAVYWGLAPDKGAL